MTKPIVFPYKTYKSFPCPIVPLGISKKTWCDTEAYVDSGASVSLFSLIEAERIGLDYERGRRIFSVVGDGSLIPVFLHKMNVRIGSVTIRATIGFSPRLGVGFNLLGRQDIFTRFDITFSDATRSITFSPRR